MDMYLIWFTLTPQAWAGLLDNPEDRRQVLEPVFAAADGTLHGYGYAFGYVLGELPDDVVTAGHCRPVSRLRRIRAGVHHQAAHRGGDAHGPARRRRHAVPGAGCGRLTPSRVNPAHRSSARPSAWPYTSGLLAERAATPCECP